MPDVTSESTLIRVNRLTDAYVKEPSSNNAKMLDLPDEEDRSFLASMDRVAAWRGIDTAEGTTLDLIGAWLGQVRGNANDAKYRILLWAQVARILCTGDINSVLYALAKTFQTLPTEISLVEIANCVMKLSKLDLAIVLAAGFTFAQIKDLIESLIPVGVRLDEIEMQAHYSPEAQRLYLGAALFGLLHFRVEPA